MMTSKGPPDQAEDRSGLLLPWRRIAGQLCPLIGDSGFCALFVRTCHVVGPDYAWLVPSQPCRSPEQLFAALEERMTLVEAARAAAANEAMLGSFTRLLAALIGEGLTQRLLATATAGADTGPGTQKNAQEQK